MSQSGNHSQASATETAATAAATAPVTELTVDPFDYFPLEISKLIFELVSVGQLMHLRRVSRKWRENIENICQLLDCMDIVDAYYAGDRGFEQAMVLKRERSSRHRKVVSTVVTRTEDRGRFLATLFPGIKHFARYCYLQSRDRLTTLDWPVLVRSWAPQLVSLDIDGNTANQLTEADFFKKELAFPALTEFILREGRSIVFITPMLVHSLLDKMRSLRRLTTGQMVTNAWAIRSVTHLSINMSSMRSYDGDAIQMAARYTKLTHLNLIYYVFNYQIYRSLSETLKQLPNLRVIAFSVNIFREGAVNEAFFEGGPSGASVVNLQFSNTWFWLQFDAEDERFIRIVGRFVTMFPNVQKMTFQGPVHQNTMEQTKAHLSESIIKRFNTKEKTVEPVWWLDEVR